MHLRLPDQKYVKLSIAGVYAMLATAALLAIRTPPVSGYEVSFVSAFPLTFWITFCSALIGSIILLIMSDIADSLSWWTGFVALGGVYALLFALPYIHGYAITGSTGSDALFHLGAARGILQTGHSTPQNWYPMVPILSAILVDTTSIPLQLAQPILSYTMSMLYIFGVGVLTRRFMRSDHIQAFGSLLAASSPLLLGVYQTGIHPAIMGFMLLPIVLLLFDAASVIGTVWSRAGVATVLVAAAIWHPVSSALIALSVGLMVVIDRHSRVKWNDRLAPGISGASVLVLLVHAAWFSQFEKFKSVIAGFFAISDSTQSGSSSGGSSGGILQQYLAELQGENIDILDLFWTFVVQDYGAVLLYGGVSSLILFSFVVWSLKSSIDETVSTTERVLSSQFIAGFIVAILFLVIDLIAANPIRVSRYFLFAAMGIIGVTMARLIASNTEGIVDWLPSSPQKRSVLAVVLVVIVLSVSLLSLGTVLSPNQLSQTTVSGSEWHLDTATPETPTRALSMSTKLQIYLQGPDAILDPRFSSKHSAYTLPRRLGYPKNQSVGNIVTEPTYMITRERSQQWQQRVPENRRSDLRYYTEADIEHLHSDAAADQIYANGQYGVWYTTPRDVATG